MNSKMSFFPIWIIAACWFLTSSLNAQVEKTDPQKSSQPDQETQDEAKREKRAQIEEKLRKRKANWQLVKDRMKTEKNYFEFDDLLRLQLAPIGESISLDDDRNFDYFLDPAVLRELKLSDELSTRLAKQANNVANEWKTSIRNAYAHRDDMALQVYHDSSRIFDGQYKLNLNKEQLERFQQIKFRSRIQRLGIPDSLMSGVIEIEATDEGKKSIVLELQAEAKKIRLEGNRLFVDQIKTLFPGYLVGWQDRDAEKLPLLPLKLFLLLADKPTAVNASFKFRFKEFDLTLRSGYWVFPSPLIRQLRSGNLTLKSNNSKFHHLPGTTERTLHQFRRTEFDKSESLEHRRILNELMAQMGIRMDAKFESTRAKLPEGLSRDEQSEFRMKQRVEINQELDNGFREQNLIPFRNYVRLHSLFSLGPDCVYEQLTQEHRDRGEEGEWPNEEEFKKKLAASTSVLAEFVDSQESRLVDSLVAEIQSLDKKSNATPNAFASPISSQYEMALIPILEHGKTGAPPRRRR